MELNKIKKNYKLTIFKYEANFVCFKVKSDVFDSNFCQFWINSLKLILDGVVPEYFFQKFPNWFRFLLSVRKTSVYSKLQTETSQGDTMENL